MKKALIIAVIFCLSLYLCVALSTRPSNDPDPVVIPDVISDYERGWDDGYELGYYDGYEEGIKNGGDGDSYADGYNDGNYDGYYSGATYTCLFFGDIERAFKCAKKGSAWYALIDGYDQYEYDIYDDDDKETRSKLFWALVSYTSKDGATKEEYDLLYSAFLSDLYYLD